MTVPVETGDELQVGAAQPLFATRLGTRLGGSVVRRNYDVNADGQRFLVANLTEEAAAPSLTVVTNWLKALER